MHGALLPRLPCLPDEVQKCGKHQSFLQSLERQYHPYIHPEKGQKKLSEAETEVNALIKEAKQQATTILDQANTRASGIVESAKSEGTSERDKIISTAHDEAQQELSKLREGLRKEVAVLAISGAEKILSREINKADHKDMLDELANKL